MEMLVYTQDRTYSNSLDKSKKEDQDQEQEHWSKTISKTNVFQVNLKDATLIELKLHFKSYYRVGSYNTKYFGFIFVSYKTSSYSSGCKSTPG